MGESTTPSGEKGTRREMIARKSRKRVLAGKRLQELTPAELTEVTGGGGVPFFNRRHHHHHHHHRHHRRFPFI
jgi:hypothetical protein